MKNNINKVFSFAVIFALLFCTFVIPAASKSVGDSELKFKDGKFKILVLSDIQDTDTPQKATTDLMKAAIEKAQPDLIALTGDNIAGWWKGVNKAETKAAVDAVASVIDSYGIPFAFVYGNHDHEGLCDDENGYTEEQAKQYILECFQKYDTCLAISGEEMTGYCNYNLLVKDSAGEKNIFNMWFMDSNPYATEEEGGGYGYVHEDQIAWYEKTANELKDQNGGNVIPSILFQHIAVPEVYDMLLAVDKGTKGAVKGHGSYSDKYYTVNPEYIYDGSLNEGPCPPDSNHGQFDSWLKTGDVLGAVFGHDHVNDFAGEYKGIKLLAAPGVGFYSYGNHHGVRTITLDESDLSDFSSEVMLYDDLVADKLSNKYIANHGYHEYKSIFLPAIIGGTAAILALGAAAIIIAKVIKKHKKNK